MTAALTVSTSGDPHLQRAQLGAAQALAEMAQQSLLGWTGDEQERYTGVSFY